MTIRLPYSGRHDLIGQEIGNYRVIRTIGRGGSGTVYEAVDVELGRRVALKVLSSPLGRDHHALQRLLAEARIVSTLRSSNIVTVTGFGRTPLGYGYVVMELLEGESLAQRIQATHHHDAASAGRGGTASADLRWLRTAVRIARQVASTMSSVHQSGIIHRDLKPENIFLVPDADVIGGERVKILDFGMAKAQEDYARWLRAPFPGLTRLEPTQAGAIMGTPAYMAPEQWAAKPAEERTDVYALGCILYEMLCGQLPFSCTDLNQLMIHHSFHPPPKLALGAQELPPALVELVRAMLSKITEDRPTMAAVAEVLRGVEGSLAQDVLISSEALRRPASAQLGVAARGRLGWTASSALLTAAVLLGIFLARFLMHAG